MIRKPEETEPDMWRSSPPRPVFDAEPGWVDFYWSAWECARGRILKKEGLPEPRYMDEAFWDDSIWIWDTAFMSLFCRYAPDAFPGIESLWNFYVPLHDGWEGLYPLNIQHPDNPPLFAWVEYDYFQLTNDREHLRRLLLEEQYLQKHFFWFGQGVPPGWKFESNTVRAKSAPVRARRTDSGYFWGPHASGMDNTPRGAGRAGEMLWVDALAQQGLSALYISRLAAAIDETSLSAEWMDRYLEIKNQVNAIYWDEEDGFYYDVLAETLEPLKVKTPASYWPLLAEMASPEQARRMLAHALDETVFGVERPWPTVARDAPGFVPEHGDYWRGAIWLPTGYMATKALERGGFIDEANLLAERLVALMYRTYRSVEPSTIWEAYSPTQDHPATRGSGEDERRVRPDFCGWSALGPISLLIENVIGFHTVNAATRTVEWRLWQAGRHGIENLRFGDVTADIVAEADGTVRVRCTKPFTLIINGATHQVESPGCVLPARLVPGLSGEGTG